MKDLLRRLFTPYASSPRRWLLVGGLVLLIAILAATGLLP